MRKGFMLITVLAILVVIAVGAAALLKSVGTHADLKSNNVRDVQAKYAAEAAMQHAIWRCRASGCVTEPIPVHGEPTPVPITVAGSLVRVTVNYADVQE